MLYELRIYSVEICHNMKQDNIKYIEVCGLFERKTDIASSAKSLFVVV